MYYSNYSYVTPQTNYLNSLGVLLPVIIIFCIPLILLVVAYNIKRGRLLNVPAWQFWVPFYGKYVYMTKLGFNKITTLLVILFPLVGGFLPILRWYVFVIIGLYNWYIEYIFFNSFNKENSILRLCLAIFIGTGIITLFIPDTEIFTPTEIKIQIPQN